MDIVRWSACSGRAEGGGCVNDIGVNGGEGVVLDISNSAALRLLVGIEKLRVIAVGGAGRGDGELEVRGLLSNIWLFETRGAEYPNALEDLA